MATERTAGDWLGQPSPEWELPLLDDGTLGVRSLRGKKTLLFFWGSW